MSRLKYVLFDRKYGLVFKQESQSPDAMTLRCGVVGAEKVKHRCSMHVRLKLDNDGRYRFHGAELDLQHNHVVQFFEPLLIKQEDEAPAQLDFMALMKELAQELMAAAETPDECVFAYLGLRRLVQVLKY